jgi:hypothetical protein
MIAPLIRILTREVLPETYFFVGDYGSGCSGTTIFTVSSITLMSDVEPCNFLVSLAASSISEI